MRTIFIGDVHGCYDELMQLLQKLEYNGAIDRLILVGDLMNKGPKSLKVLEYVKTQNIEFVLGNHERAFIKQVKAPGKHANSISRLIDQMGLTVARMWADWLEHAPYYIDDKDFLVVHAGIAPDVPFKMQDDRILCTIRTWDGVGDQLNDSSDPPWWQFYEGKKPIIYGHWAAQGLHKTRNTIGLDSGCVYGKQLTAYLLPDKAFIQVDALQPYIKVK